MLLLLDRNMAEGKEEHDVKRERGERAGVEMRTQAEAALHTRPLPV